MSLKTRTILAGALAAVALAGAIVHAQEAPEAPEPYGDFDADWVKSDLAMIARIRKALPAEGRPLSEVLERLGERAEDLADATADLAFGATRVPVEIYGGYTTTWIRLAVREGRVAAVDIHGHTGPEFENGLRDHLLPAWGMPSPWSTEACGSGVSTRRR